MVYMMVATVTVSYAQVTRILGARYVETVMLSTQSLRSLDKEIKKVRERNVKVSIWFLLVLINNIL